MPRRAADVAALGPAVVVDRGNRSDQNHWRPTIRAGDFIGGTRAAFAAGIGESAVGDVDGGLAVRRVGAAAVAGPAQRDPRRYPDRQIGHVNRKRACSKLNDLACRAAFDRILDVGEVVLSSTERIDRRTDRRPARNAADALHSRVCPVRINVVVGGQNPHRRVGACLSRRRQ